MRLTVLVSIAVGLLILGALALRGAIAPEAVRLRLEATFAEVLGSPVGLAGSASVRLLPTPRIDWRDVTLTDAKTGATRLVAHVMETPLALVPLLRGEVVPRAVVLDAPVASLDRADLVGVANRLRHLPTFDLRVRHGRLDLRLSSDRVESLEAVTTEITRGPTDLAIDLAARWRGETLDLDVTLPLDATARRWRLAVAVADAALKASGTRDAGTSALAGTIELSLPDPDRLARLVAPGPWGDLVHAPLTLEATLATDAKTLTLTDLALTVAGSRASGSLALASEGGMLALSGTIAFADLDLTGPAPVFGEAWRDLPLDGRRPELALDLRLSAKRLLTSGFELVRPAASLNLADGRLNAEIGDARLWGRPISALLVGDLGGDGLAARLRAVAKDLPAAEVGHLFAIDGVEAGTISAAFEGETRCATVGACVGAMAGRLRLTAASLAVTGNSPFGDVTRFHPIVVAPKPAVRKAVWPEAEAEIRLVGPAATVDLVEMRAADARFALKGNGDLTNGTVDLTGHAFFRNLRAAPAPSAAREIRIPLQIRGTLRKLEITPAMPEQMPIEAPVAPLAPIPIVPPIAAPAR